MRVRLGLVFSCSTLPPVVVRDGTLSAIFSRRGMENSICASGHGDRGRGQSHLRFCAMVILLLVHVVSAIMVMINTICGFVLIQCWAVTFLLDCRGARPHGAGIYGEMLFEIRSRAPLFRASVHGYMPLAAALCCDSCRWSGCCGKCTCSCSQWCKDGRTNRHHKC